MPTISIEMIVFGPWIQVVCRLLVEVVVVDAIVDVVVDVVVDDVVCILNMFSHYLSR